MPLARNVYLDADRLSDNATRADADGSIDSGAQYPKAVAKITSGTDGLLEFCK
ncbi:hypothetical protein OHB12_35615 [Nocardia sp. NBC_01730]|uniref:hypothetical protein n=1 Tax=Nocardia sp. NBC_01730 TaxID=2975998 RepID=UPI002E0F3A86|nr:hypothetical protein OHB12_35615 [Nocardia sp. NBC_01730]